MTELARGAYHQRLADLAIALAERGSLLGDGDGLFLAGPPGRDQPVLEGGVVRVRPFRAEDLDALWTMVNDPEGARLTGTHATFTRAQIDAWYGSRGEDDDRLDLAIATLDDDQCVGEVVLGGLDPDNASCWFRIGLIGPEVYGRGYGTEATRLLVGHAFGTVGLHRIELEVYAFNHRARHVYEKLGFRVEGTRCEALHWDGVYHDAIVIGLLAQEWRDTGPA
jgi:RimJ/RimL family protein N-acetyltransferase